MIKNLTSIDHSICPEMDKLQSYITRQVRLWLFIGNYLLSAFKQQTQVRCGIRRLTVLECRIQKFNRRKSAFTQVTARRGNGNGDWSLKMLYTSVRGKNSVCSQCLPKQGRIIMSTIEEIKEAISKLPEDQYTKIRRWFTEEDWKSWDAQIERDSASGKLDFLVDEANNDEEEGKLREV